MRCRPVTIFEVEIVTTLGATFSTTGANVVTIPSWVSPDQDQTVTVGGFFSSSSPNAGSVNISPAMDRAIDFKQRFRFMACGFQTGNESQCSIVCQCRFGRKSGL